ncbi:MAG: outer membrane beta-barrel protein [Betaproteobacteria bacterium]
MPIAAAKTLLACLLLLASAGAAAQTYFLGGSLGQSDIDRSIAASLIDAGSIDGKDSAWKIYGGGFVGRHLGAELAYIDLGEARYSGSFFGAPVTDGRVAIWGYNVSALARFPLGPQLEVFGKLGVFLWESEEGDVTGGDPSARTVRGWEGGSFGIGAAWRFSRHLAVRAEWEHLPLDFSEASLLSLGIQYNF